MNGTSKVNRYPGSRPFQDDQLDRKLFKGREDEKRKLLHLILSEKLVVFYAKSGVGKTSLLNAGVFKELRKRGYFPVSIRLNDPNRDISEMIYHKIENVADEYRINFVSGNKTSLWHYFKTTVFWSEDDIRLTPVLVFDQFEELFTLEYPESRKREFIGQFAALARGVLPESVLNSLSDDDRHQYGERGPEVKIVISIREDFLAMLEELSPQIPAILTNRFRLLPMTPEQARIAIEEPAILRDESLSTREFTYDEKAITAILNFLQKRKEGKNIVDSNEIEPFQLQLLCQHIEKSIYNRQHAEAKKMDYSVNEEDLGGESGMQRILQDFYANQIGQIVLGKRRAVRRLCEKKLISHTGRRLSLEEETIVKTCKVSKSLLSQLIDNRLLRGEPRLGSNYYELSHDTLVKPILDSLRKRMRRRRRIVISTVAGVVLVIFGLGLWTGIFNTNKIQLAYELELNGKYEEANKIYRQELIRDPDYYKAYTLLGDNLLKLHKYDSTFMVYKKAISIKPDKDDLFQQAGNYIVSQGDDDEAIKFYKEALKINELTYKYSYRALAAIYKRKSDYESVRINLKKVVEISPSGESYNDLGIMYDEMEQNDSAIANYKKAIQLEPTFKYAFHNIGLVFYDGMKLDSANYYFQKVLDIDPNDIPSLNSIGSTYYTMKEYEEAKRYYKRAISLDSNYIFSNYNLGLIYEIIKNNDSAIYFYAQTLELDSTYTRALTGFNVIEGLLGLEITDLYQQRKYTLAVKKSVTLTKSLERLLKIYPKDGAIRKRLARSYGGLAFYQLFTGQFEDTIASAQKGLELDASEEWIHTNLALGYLLTGQYSEAEAIYLDFKETLREGFLQDFKDLEKAEIINKDNENVNKIKQLLK